MPTFQLLECMVALAGDEGQHRPPLGQDTPGDLSRAAVLQYVHGDDAVSDVHMLGTEERDNQAELDRLRRTYNAAAVKDVFPGANPSACRRRTSGSSRARRRRRRSATSRRRGTICRWTG
jgi:hypothetical protein